MSEWQLLLEHLRQPEYMHVLLNPLPTYGMAAGVFMLAVSWLRRSSGEQTTALIWITLMGAVTWLVVQYGIKGYDRVYAMSSSSDAQLWLQVHMNRAEKAMYVFYLTGLAALGTVIASRKAPKVAGWLRGITLVFSVICVGLGGWIAHAGGQVRHSEFRDGPPHPNQLPASHHAHPDGASIR